MPSLKDIVDAMGTRWPVALAIFIAAASYLISDYWALDYLEHFPEWAVGAAFVAAILSGSVLVVAMLRGIGDFAMRPIRRRRLATFHQEQVASLEDLPEAEAMVLIWAVANRTQVFAGPYFNPQIKALMAKGLLIIPPGSHHSDQMPLYIPDHIWKALKEDAGKAPAEQIEQLVGLDVFRLL